MNLFRRRKTTPTEAAQTLAELSVLAGRERIRARARIMCEQLGRPVPEVLR